MFGTEMFVSSGCSSSCMYQLSDISVTINQHARVEPSSVICLQGLVWDFPLCLQLVETVIRLVLFTCRLARVGERDGPYFVQCMSSCQFVAYSLSSTWPHKIAGVKRGDSGDGWRQLTTCSYSVILFPSLFRTNIYLYS